MRVVSCDDERVRGGAARIDDRGRGLRDVCQAELHSGRDDFLDSFRSMREKVTLHCEGDYREITIVGDIGLRNRRSPDPNPTERRSPAKDMAGNTLSHSSSLCRWPMATCTRCESFCPLPKIKPAGFPGISAHNSSPH